MIGEWPDEVHKPVLPIDENQAGEELDLQDPEQLLIADPHDNNINQQNANAPLNPQGLQQSQAPQQPQTVQSPTN